MFRRRNERDDDLRRELQSHLDAEALEQEERGVAADEAHYAARRAFGNVGLVTEDVRESWGWMWLERFAQDFRYALRTLRKDRIFMALAVSALALGIGAATVIFSVVDNVVLEPFPYADQQRLTKFYIHDPAHADQIGRPDFTFEEYRTFAEQNHVFDSMIASVGTDVLYTGANETKLFPGYKTTANTFDFLGVPPLLGRVTTSNDGLANSAPVAVMSYRAWTREFNSDPSIVGRMLTLNGIQTTVIGVMPPRFQLYDGDFWMPITVPDPNERYTTLARLQHGVTMEQAASDLDVVAHNLAKITPRIYPPRFNVTAISLVDRVVRNFRPVMYAFMAAVMMLLLIACSNVANLLLARSTAREVEISIRASLGASRARLITQLMVESFLLACLGCIAGCAAAYGGIRGIAAALPRDLIPNESVIRLNPRVLLFALGMALLTTLLSGLAPAMHAVRRDLYERAKSTGKGGGIGARHGRLRSALVVAQVALSIVLLVGAGLMMRSVLAIEHVDLGFNPDHVLAARIPFPRGRYDTAEQKRVFFTSVIQRIQTLPGVTAAATTSSVPPSGGMRTDITIPGDDRAEKLRASVQLCSEGFFPAMDVRLLRGRLLTDNEVTLARHVIVVNESLAKRFFGSVDGAIGRSMKFNFFDIAPDSPRDAYFEIVGVVGDLRNDGLEGPPVPQAFVPYTVTGISGRQLVVRSAVDPMSILPSIEREVRAVDPGIALTLAASLKKMIAEGAYAQPRFEALVLTLFAAVGLLISAIGIFSVMAYAVTLQTREIGIRLALGARRASVMKMVLRNGLATIIAGIAIGEIASLAATRVLRTQLFGVSAHDPAILAGVVAVLIVVGILACIVPARRATLIEPTEALRYE